ncbi:MAG: hypothetical protein SH857_04340 [Chitinophagales bacterium]|nr:hypothetical protein [Chitinophagales bacterium]
MLKKYTALLFFTIAYALILGHNIIPHHHHDSNHDLAEHQQLHQEHDDNHEDGLNHLFAHFVHSGDAFTFTTNHNINNVFSKQLFLMAVALSDNFSLDRFSVLPLVFSPPEKQVIYISPHSLASGLRAPPAFIA